MPLSLNIAMSLPVTVTSKRLHSEQELQHYHHLTLMSQVFQAEYSLMCDIVNCPIPYMSLCNGIWMGFGVGFAVHGDIRVVTENTMFAMPENMIGLWPDVGFARVAANTTPG